MLKQSPDAFTTQPQGTTVFITVSTYEKPSADPHPDPDAAPATPTPHRDTADPAEPRRRSPPPA